jgi:phage-related tail fiber protein
MSGYIGSKSSVTQVDGYTRAEADPRVVPSGAVFMFTADAAPAGYLKANGATISRTTYATLFAVIGTTFGAGDGSTTFQLPDLRGEFLRGWDDSRGVDTSRAFGSAQGDNVGAHEHRVRAGDRSGWASDFFGVGSPVTINSYASTYNGPTGETRPRNVALLACIKY